MIRGELFAQQFIPKLMDFERISKEEAEGEK